MSRLGYGLVFHQSGPEPLVTFARQAEDIGFDVEVCIDHRSPCTSQGDAGDLDRAERVEPSS